MMRKESKRESWKWRRSLPNIVFALMLIAVVSSLMFVFVNAVTNYTIVKPVVVELASSPPDLTIEGANFTYDPASNRYTSIQVDVRNPTSGAITASVSVYLYNSAGTQVSSGSYTGVSIPAATTSTISVTLTWTGTYNVTDFDTGKIVVVQA